MSMQTTVADEPVMSSNVLFNYDRDTQGRFHFKAEMTGRDSKFSDVKLDGAPNGLDYCRNT